MPEAQISLRNTVQCDSTLLTSIITDRFVTGGQYSSRIRVARFIRLTQSGSEYLPRCMHAAGDSLRRR